MGTGKDYLDGLADELKSGKSAVCRRAIGRVLALVKARREKGEYKTRNQAEEDLLRLVRSEVARKKA